MTISHTQLITPVNTIIFDCDGTLSMIEGIDVLAEKKGVADRVAPLTTMAMGSSGLTLDLYKTRLSIVKPNREDVLALSLKYYDRLVPDTDAVFQLLHRLKKTIYIISAGLTPAVIGFGKLLQVPAQNIFAVDITFDGEGQYVNFDQQSPLVNTMGKRLIVGELKKQFPELIYVGDGINDYAVYDLVTRFIGFGGAFYRANLAALCEYYVTVPSMTAILPWILTAIEYETLTPSEQILYRRGLLNDNAPP